MLEKREVRVEKMDGDKIVVTETITTTKDRYQLQNQIYSIQQRKQSLVDQSKRLKQEYDELESERLEMEKALSALDGENEGVEVL